MIARHLPAAPTDVLDVGGGPGVYARWLAGLGYRVHVVEPIPVTVTIDALLVRTGSL